jgi:hypothetical protein
VSGDQPPPPGWSRSPAPTPGWGSPAPAGPGAAPVSGSGSGSGSPGGTPRWLQPARRPTPAPYPSSQAGLPPGLPRAAHRPGAFPLRPLVLGDILDGAFRIIRYNPRATVGAAVLVSALAMVLPVVVGLVSGSTGGLRIDTGSDGLSDNQDPGCSATSSRRSACCSSRG